MQTRSQAAAAAARAARHPQADETFALGLASVFRQWTALSLAVTHQWGGPNSQQKADLLLDDILRTFQGPEKIYKDDISLILDDSLENDFNTLCEDESTDEVGELLVKMWRKCAEGDFSMVNEIIAKEPKAQESLKKSQGLDNGDDVDSDDENDGLDMAEALQISGFSTTATIEPSSTINTDISSDHTLGNALVPNDAAMESDEPAVDPEGWEIAGKNRRNRRKK